MSSGDGLYLISAEFSGCRPRFAARLAKNLSLVEAPYQRQNCSRVDVAPLKVRFYRRFLEDEVGIGHATETGMIHLHKRLNFNLTSGVFSPKTWECA